MPNVTVAPDLLTVTDATNALRDLAAQRPATVEGKVLRWSAIAEVYEARARLWDTLGNRSFEAPGVDPELVAAAWHCASADRDEAERARNAVERWSKRGRR